MAESNRNEFTHSSGGWKSTVKLLAGSWLPLKVLWAIPTLPLPSSWWLPAVLGALGSHHPSLSSVITQYSLLCLCSKFPLSMKASVTGLGPILIQYDLNLTCISANSLFPSKVTIPVLELQVIFSGDTIQPLTMSLFDNSNIFISSG